MIKIYSLFIIVFYSFIAVGQKTTSHFLFPKFEEAEVIFKNGSVTKAMLNYNLLSEKMMFLQNADSLVLISSDNFAKIRIGEREFVKGPSNYYLEIIEGEKSQLYIKTKAKIVSEGKMSAYGGRSQVSSIKTVSYLSDSNSGNIYSLNTDEKQTFIIERNFYFKVKNRFRLLNSQRDFKKAFPKKKDFIDQYFENHEVDFTNQKEVLYLVDIIAN